MSLVKKAKSAWKAETPRIAKALQTISAAIALMPVYYTSLPDEFKSTIPQTWLKYVAIVGGLSIFLLQFFTKKQNNEIR